MNSISSSTVSKVEDSDVLVGKVLCKYCPDETVAVAHLTRLKAKSHKAWAQMASEEESIGRDDLAVLAYVLSWQFQKATAIGLGGEDGCS